ncbi:NAD(P)-binding domain-containing protein [Gordonia rhizosphera]|nr:NAD(P)-binding domain-containing protein [Gordonia rhizosphera]
MSERDMAEGANRVDEPLDLRAGVVGLGMIGGGVAVSLARKGRTPVVYDIRSEAADALEGVPAVVESPADVARGADVVLVAVVNGEQARSVIGGDGGILEGARPGAVVALLSTVDIETVRELSATCADQEVGFLDAGVTGGTQAAQNGLTVMVGGPEDVYRRARPILEDFAGAVVYCGELGAGMTTKLARNALTYSMWAAVREAASIAEAGGVALDKLLEVLEHSDGGTHPLTLLRVHTAGLELPADQVDTYDALAQKDLAAAQRFAGSVGVELPIVNVVRPRMRAVYSGERPEPLSEDAWERGLQMMDRIYGPGYRDMVPAGLHNPSVDETVAHLFADIWSRPHLTVRDRRLLVIGATVMLGRQDLLETQIRGAAAAGEFTADQLREMVLQMQTYGGPGNGTNLMFAVEKIIAETENL